MAIQYPAGAVKTHAELTDLIAEAGKTRRAIRLHLVEQGGYQASIIVTGKTRIVASQGFGTPIYSFEGWAKATWRPYGWYKSHRCLGDLNIADKTGRSGGHNRHMLFRNKRCADEYAHQLQNDPVYQQEVREHHARCARAFRDAY